MAEQKRGDPRWIGSVLLVECATCSRYPGRFFDLDYSAKGTRCEACHGAGWIVLAELPAPPWSAPVHDLPLNAIGEGTG